MSETAVPITEPTGARLSVEDLKVWRADADGERLLVHGVSLEVRPRRTVAVVGESGSGKSMSTLAIVRLTPPGTRVEARSQRLGDLDLGQMSDAEIARLRGRRIAIVFQNPMVALNPVLTVGRQLTQVLRRHEGMKGAAARARAVELLEEVEIADPAGRVSRYPFEMSGGMLQRVMIAIALAVRPDILIADEPTTALDTTLQAQIMELLRRRQQELGMGVILISHDLGVVAANADEVAVMYAGRVVERAEVRTLFAAPAHPYTQALLHTVQDIASPDTAELSPIPGSPPRLDQLPAGCPFAPRCPVVMDRCRVEDPQLLPLAGDHEAACHRAAS